MSTIKADTLSNVAGDKTIPTDRVAQGTAAAWVNFNGIDTVAIRRAFNVSSIEDNGTGDYTVNFTTAMPDADYCVAVSASNNTAIAERMVSPYAYTTSSVSVSANDNASALSDSEFVHVAIFR